MSDKKLENLYRQAGLPVDKMKRRRGPMQKYPTLQDEFFINGHMFGFVSKQDKYGEYWSLESTYLLSDEQVIDFLKTIPHEDFEIIRSRIEDEEWETEEKE
jgi:hypothetical protein